jgi:uncharacterized membrane protein YkoI
MGMTKNVIAILTAAGLTLAGCSQKSKVERTSQEFNALPTAVQKTVRSHAPNAEIASVDRKNRDGMNYYVIEFREPGTNPKINVAENGTILPNDIERSMGSSSPGTGTVSGRAYDRGATNSSLGAPNGTPGRAATIDLSALPVPVQKALKSQVPNGLVKNIKRHDENGRAVYEIEFEDEGKNPTMRIADDGTVVQTLKK